MTQAPRAVLNSSVTNDTSPSSPAPPLGRDVVGDLGSFRVTVTVYWHDQRPSVGESRPGHENNLQEANLVSCRCVERGIRRNLSGIPALSLLDFVLFLGMARTWPPACPGHLRFTVNSPRQDVLGIARVASRAPSDHDDRERFTSRVSMEKPMCSSSPD